MLAREQWEHKECMHQKGLYLCCRSGVSWPVCTHTVAADLRRDARPPRMQSQVVLACSLQDSLVDRGGWGLAHETSHLQGQGGCSSHWTWSYTRHEATLLHCTLTSAGAQCTTTDIHFASTAPSVFKLNLTNL